MRAKLAVARIFVNRKREDGKLKIMLGKQCVKVLESARGQPIVLSEYEHIAATRHAKSAVESKGTVGIFEFDDVEPDLALRTATADGSSPIMGGAVANHELNIVEVLVEHALQGAQHMSLGIVGKHDNRDERALHHTTCHRSTSPGSPGLQVVLHGITGRFHRTRSAWLHVLYKCSATTQHIATVYESGVACNWCAPCARGTKQSARPVRTAHPMRAA